MLLLAPGRQDSEVSARWGQRRKIGDYPTRKSLTLFGVSYRAAFRVMVRQTSGEICDFIELGERLCTFLSGVTKAVPEMSRLQKIQQVARRG